MDLCLLIVCWEMIDSVQFFLVELVLVEGSISDMSNIESWRPFSGGRGTVVDIFIVFYAHKVVEIFIPGLVDVYIALS